MCERGYSPARWKRLNAQFLRLEGNLSESGEPQFPPRPPELHLVKSEQEKEAAENKVSIEIEEADVISS